MVYGALASGSFPSSPPRQSAAHPLAFSTQSLSQKRSSQEAESSCYCTACRARRVVAGGRSVVCHLVLPAPALHIAGALHIMSCLLTEMALPPLLSFSSLGSDKMRHWWPRAVLHMLLVGNVTYTLPTLVKLPHTLLHRQLDPSI